MFDLLIENGALVDGTGAPRRPGNLGIKGEAIVTLDAPAASPAKTRLDGAGKVVAPGFIDIHAHSDISLLLSPTADSFLRQGVTTQVVGNCGLSFAPIGGENEDDFRQRFRFFALDTLPFRWNTFAEYRNVLASQKPATNVACQVGQSPLRSFVIGWRDGPPSPPETARISSLAEEVIDQGAVGISLGLEYFPGSHSSFEELAALGKVAAKKGVPLSIHLRNEADLLLEALQEAVRIAEESACQVEVAHLKAGGRNNWGRVKDAVPLLEAAQARGVRIAFDAYPYTAWISPLLTCIPPRFISDGPPTFAARLRVPSARQEVAMALLDDEAGPAGINISQDADRVTIAWVTSEKNKGLIGRTLAQISQEMDRSPVDAILTMLEQEEGQVGAIVAGMSEDDVAFLMARPDCVIVSDSASIDPSTGTSDRAFHPRFFGSFVRFLAEYARKQGLDTLEHAIHRITQMPAQRYHLDRRGLLKPGCFADLVVFDPEAIQDCATYLNPAQFPTGISTVIVNGQIAWQPGMEKPAQHGRVL